MNGSSASFARRVLFVAAVALLAFVAWRLLGLFVLVFGAVVGAVILRSVASLLERRVGVPNRYSVLAAVLLLLALLAGAGALIGQPLSEQIELLGERLPQAWNKFVGWLGQHRFGVALLRLWGQAQGGNVPWARIASVAGLTLETLASGLLMFVTAVYLAADPRTYQTGLLRLLPPAVRGRADGALRESGDGLRRWLKGQAVSMLFIGASTTVGLALLGAPLPLALGLISGLLAFVPFVGAIVGGLLAVLVAFIDSPRTALYVAILALAIQQAEEYVVLPIVQRWAVRLPPVLGLVATVMFGALFGVPGVLLATPLMVVAMILVRRLYVEDALEGRRPA
jgi:predicted PurR-regulated permease PerM